MPRTIGTKWVGPIIIAMLVAGFAYSINNRNPFSPVQNVGVVREPPLQTISTTSTASIIVDLGIPSPSADRDKRLHVDIVTGSSTLTNVDSGWRVTSMEDRSRFQDGGGWDVERTNVLGVSGGFVWLASFIPGEGIESEPTGPSKLIRIGKDASSEVVATESTIIDRVASDGTRIAYGFGGTYIVVDHPELNGQGIPLLWLKDGRLLISRGTSLMITGKDGETRVAGTLPGEPSIAVVVE